MGEIRGDGPRRGKSHLNASRLYRPKSGISAFGPRRQHLADQIARLGIARTFQNVQLFRSMSALDNVLVARHSHMRTGVLAEGLALPFVHRQERLVRDKAEELMEFLGLVDVKRQTAGNLPLGSQKRLELARALALEPELVLLDEPASGLNTSETQAFAELLRQVRDRFKLTVCSSSTTWPRDEHLRHHHSGELRAQDRRRHTGRRAK